MQKKQFLSNWEEYVREYGVSGVEIRWTPTFEKSSERFVKQNSEGRGNFIFVKLIGSSRANCFGAIH